MCKVNRIVNQLFSHALIGMSFVSLDGQSIKVNPALCKMTGYTEKELLSLTNQDITHPDDLDTDQQLKQELLEGKRDAYELEKRYIHKNGHHVWVVLSAFIVQEENQPLFFSYQIQDISERKHLKQNQIDNVEHLRQSNMRIQQIMKTAKLGTALIDVEQGRILESDFVLQQIMGYPEEELLNKPFSDITYPDDHQLNMDLYQELLDGKRNHYHLEKRYIRKDGTLIWGDLTVCMLNNNPPAIMAMVQDITHRKKMEKEIHESEEKYRLISENVSDLVSVLDTEGKILYASPSHVPELGIKPENLMNKFVHPFIHPDDLPMSISIFHEMFKTGSEKTYECRFKHAASHWVNFELNAKPVIDRNGVISQIVFVSRNISERKRAERKLQESEERFRLMAEYASDMISIQDLDRKYLYVSPACFRLLGYKENELLGNYLYDLIHPDDHPTFQERRNELLKMGYISSTYRIRKRNGHYIWFESNVRVFEDSEGVKRIIAISRDITARKQLEQQLIEAQGLWQQLSTMDGLTGIANRRFFDENLEIEWRRAARNSTPLSLILIDIDYFKIYNDTYGHQSGDECLKQVAQAIKQTLQRPMDLVCRYGGEEFVIILPETNEDGAMKVAEKIRAAIENLAIPNLHSTISDYVTISAGYATKIPTNLSNMQDIILRSDKALYLAKNDGRNRVKGYV